MKTHTTPVDNVPASLGYKQSCTSRDIYRYIALVKENSEKQTDRRKTMPHLWKPGQSGNPAGRPKGKTMKEYAREWFLQLSDEDKQAYILALEEKRPGFAWVMSEGNPTEDRTITVKVPTPILGGLSQEKISNQTSIASNQATIEASLEASASEYPDIEPPAVGA